MCESEPRNPTNRYAMAVLKDGVIIGHTQTKDNFTSLLTFPEERRNHSCTVTGRRRYSVDISQGGLKIPCLVVFRAEPKNSKKLVRLIHVSKGY